MSDETTPSIEYIDGPMLPHLLQSSTATNANASHAPTSLVPIITPPLVHTSQARDVADAQQYLLVPNSQRIIVRSAHHGKRVCTLVPEEGEQSIWAVTLVWLPLRGVDDNKNNNCNAEKDDEEGKGEWVVIAGCSDGTLQEWSVAKFLTTYNEGVTPRRIFQLKCSKTESVRMTHLSSPVVSNATLASALFDEKGGSPLYGLIKGADNNSKKNPSWVVSCLIPPFVENRHEIVVKPLVSTKVLKSTTPREEEVRLQKKHVCLKEGDSIFLLQAACRPSSSTGSTGSMDYVVDEEGSNCVSNADIFLVICASRGFVVYRECIKSLSSKHEDSHVHFKLPLKPFYQSKDLTTFSSIAISPDTKNLALGRASGHIEILDNVFDNITKFLKNQDNCQQQHPEIVTVRKSVHWHANPVRALAFLADSGRHKGNSGSIISGGEESVLVTWQLDRDFHRPSHFVSRVGQGGILYALCSVHSGKIFVFCSDNSVQCYHGSNYDRLWTEQGIASMVLHEDVKGEEEAHDLKKGGILMLRDPITGYLMLANLPGAPGMIHWYDSKGASVVGTLEVSPYNRVSRRDPLVDPNIPTPAVTHIAIGQDGKDIVTVDIAWTENKSVGEEYALVGPQGDKTPMSVCTSIKFFSFSDVAKGRKLEQRRRRHGDLPMSYELVSSMSSSMICALAISPNGATACTLSRQEDAFRIWTKTTTNTSSGVTWKCLYKVKTPAGFANLLARNTGSLPGHHLVAFSSDGSVLSVCYGTHVTLWDHADASLLKSFSFVGGIRHLHFLSQDDDYLLLTSESQVAIKSPFGGSGQSCYLGNDEWAVDLSAFGKNVKVTTVIPFADNALGAKGFFAMSVVVDNGAETVVMVVSRSECGIACVKDTDILMCWRINGEIRSLCVNEGIGSGVELLAITEDCRMLSLKVGIHTAKSFGLKNQVTSITRAQAPALQVVPEVKSKPMKRRKVSPVVKGIGKSQHFAAGFEFPSLSGKFTTSFLSGKGNMQGSM